MLTKFLHWLWWFGFCKSCGKFGHHSFAVDDDLYCYDCFKKDNIK